VRTIFHGGQVFDSRAGELKAADVVVEGGVFVDVGPGLDGDDGIDCSGRTLLPGLFDCHTHVVFSDVNQLRRLQTPFSYQYYEAAVNLRKTLDIGITTVRDAAGADLGVKQAVADGLIAGPRMQISISMISQTGGHGDSWMVCGGEMPFGVGAGHPGKPRGIVDGPEEMRRKVRELIRAGSDVIKVATSGGVLSPRDDPRHGHFRDDELEVLVREATAAGKFVMAHAQATDGIKSAIRAGIRSIEHGIYLDDEAIDMMLANGTWLVPTLVAPRGVIDAAAAGMPINPYVLQKAEMVMGEHDESVRKAIEAGVKVAMGTDSGVAPHGHNLRELELMVARGMTPAQALVATTLSAAELMGLEQELGSIEPGKRADVVVLGGDPYDVPNLTEHVEQVWKDGRLVADHPAWPRRDQLKDWGTAQSAGE
jgi:imidazolonepropionase-like amidohydrolase